MCRLSGPALSNTRQAVNKFPDLKKTLGLYRGLLHLCWKVERNSTLARFESTILPYLNAAYNLARWLTGNTHDAEDVVQESYLRALHSFDRFRPGADGRAWLLKIVRNTCFTWLRQNRPGAIVSQFDEESDAGAEALTPEAVLLEKADSERLHSAVEDLPYEYREVLILREWEGLSYKEIAEIAGIPLGTVMSRLSRSRKELERRLCGTREEARPRPETRFRQEATS